MGIGDFLRRGVSEMMVARPDEAKNHIIYKHPDKTIPMKSQLTVDQDEIALFFKDGKIQGLVQPGRHTLDTSNILKPYLLRGELQVIGATTHEEFRTNLEKDQSLTRCFQTIAVEEPTIDEAVEMACHVKGRYESQRIAQI